MLHPSPDSVVLQVNSTDLDHGFQGVPRYSLLTSGNEQGRFDVDEVTGEVKVVGYLDREVTSNYSLTVSKYLCNRWVEFLFGKLLNIE